MRILQLIDSLETGGAERMAVNYANALAQRIEYSALVATRAEGDLKSHLDAKVDYLFLNKRTTADFAAAKRLVHFCQNNKIDVVHAHSSSYFIAVWSKLLGLKAKIIWHDHNGMSEYLATRPVLALKVASYFFSGIIAVNHLLKEWAVKKLNFKKVVYLPNFADTSEKSEVSEINLAGISGKRILCLANLRAQKNHFLLLEVAARIEKKYPEWTFHFVGKDFHDDYSAKLKTAISDAKLECVFIYGATNNSVSAIRQSEICVISSVSEGLPVALLEYGTQKRAVVCTDVGEIRTIIQSNENGFIVPSQDVAAFTIAVIELISSAILREKFGEKLHQTVNDTYSADAVLQQYLGWLQEI